MQTISSHKKSAFTLIELLVVIAIIAILAAILFPVFARARENARRSSCQSNLKQMALGVVQYVQDYDEKFPGAVIGTPPEAPVGWADAIQPYLKSIQIYQCPSDTREQRSNPANSGYVDYFYNSALSNTGSTTTPNYGAGGISVAAVENSSLTILNLDANGISTSSKASWHYNGNGASTSTTSPSIPASGGFAGGTDSTLMIPFIPQKHLEGVTVSFSDGHVKWYRIEAANPQTSFYRDNTPSTTSQNKPTFNAIAR